MSDFPPPPPSGPTAPDPGQPQPQRGFFSGLFDIRFNTLVTPSVITVLYVIIIVLIGIFYLLAVVAGFSDSSGQGLAILILGPLVALLYLIFARIYLEVIMAVFKIAEHTRRSAEALERHPR